MHISKIRMLKSKSKENLNTLVGVSQMQYSTGFESAIENVYLESNRFINIDGQVSSDGCVKLCEFCSKNQEKIELSQAYPFSQGMYEAYQLCKDTINAEINKPATVTI